MILELMRYGFALDSTLGRLYVDRREECFTLEDEKREVKVPGETAIPAGTYPVAIRHGSPKFGHYDERWEWHNGMLWLQDVPDFSWVYIHPGVSDDDTAGCILPGVHPVVHPDGEFGVSRSREAYRKLYLKVRGAVDDGGVEMTVMDDLSRERAA